MEVGGVEPPSLDWIQVETLAPPRIGKMDGLSGIACAAFGLLCETYVIRSVDGSTSAGTF